TKDHEVRMLFLARTPPISWSVYDVRNLKASPVVESPVHVGEHQLENERYRVTLNENGDVDSIVDKVNGSRELLASPARLVFTHEKPQNWPAWNMDWADRQKPPVDAVSGPARIRVIERGPVRAAIEVERSTRNSSIVQRISLSRGQAGNRVEFSSTIDWQSD